jgi:hypothetical protein
MWQLTEFTYLAVLSFSVALEVMSSRLDPDAGSPETFLLSPKPPHADIRIDHQRFLSNPFLFITHSPFYNSALCTLTTTASVV